MQRVLRLTVDAAYISSLVDKTIQTRALSAGACLIEMPNERKQILLIKGDTFNQSINMIGSFVTPESLGRVGIRSNGQVSEQQAGGSDSFSWCRPSKDDPHAQAAPPPKKRGTCHEQAATAATQGITIEGFCQVQRNESRGRGPAARIPCHAVL